MDLLKLTEQYATSKKTTVLAHRITGKEITFVLASGPKLTLTESQLQMILTKTDAVGTVADGVPSASPEVARSATKPKTKKEG